MKRTEPRLNQQELAQARREIRDRCMDMSFAQMNQEEIRLEKKITKLKVQLLTLNELRIPDEHIQGA